MSRSSSRSPGAEGDASPEIRPRAVAQVVADPGAVRGLVRAGATQLARCRGRRNRSGRAWGSGWAAGVGTGLAHMIEIIEDMPARTIGFRASGKVTGRGLGHPVPAVMNGSEAGEARCSTLLPEGHAVRRAPWDTKLWAATCGWKQCATVTDEDWLENAIQGVSLNDARQGQDLRRRRRGRRQGSWSRRTTTDRRDHHGAVTASHGARASSPNPSKGDLRRPNAVAQEAGGARLRAFFRPTTTSAWGPRGCPVRSDAWVTFPPGSPARPARSGSRGR